MRLITRKRLQDYAARHPTIAPTLGHWTILMRDQDFSDFVALRRIFPSADQVAVASGNPVTIFNIKIVTLNLKSFIIFLVFKFLKLLSPMNFYSFDWRCL